MEPRRRTSAAGGQGGARRHEAECSGERFAVSLRAVNKWMAATCGGLRALKSRRRGRRPAGRLDSTQSARIRGLIVSKMPDQLKLPFYLWTRAGVATLIEREYGMAVSLTTVGRYLRAWGMTPQKPVRRAYERNDSAIKRWLVEEYPALAADARARAGHDLLG